MTVNPTDYLRAVAEKREQALRSALAACIKWMPDFDMIWQESFCDEEDNEDEMRAEYDATMSAARAALAAADEGEAGR